MKSYFLKELKYQFRKLWQRWAKPLAQCSVALMISVGTLFFWTTAVGQKLDLWVLRTFFEIRGPRPPPKDVVIVAIDDESYQKLEASTRQPFPRIHVARALERIVAAKPRVLIIDANIPKERIDLEADALIVKALESGPTTIWSGDTPISFQKGSNEDPKFVSLPSDPQFVAAAKMQLPMMVGVTHGVVANIALSQKKSDGLYERVPLSKPLVELAKISVGFPGERDYINYYGLPGTISRIPIYKLLEEGHGLIQSQLMNKVVLFGFQSIARARGQIDKEELDVSISDSPMFGVEIHANVIGNLIDGSWLKRGPLPTELSVLYVVALLIAVIGIKFAPERAIPFCLIAIFLIFYFAYFNFVNEFRWYGGIGAILLAVLLTIVGSAIYHYVIIKGFKAYIQKTFKFDLEKKI